jgi:putative intracellular protease/amidase
VRLPPATPRAVANATKDDPWDGRISREDQFIQKLKTVAAQTAIKDLDPMIKHNKDFDLLVVPGMDHGSGGAYGDHQRYDYFVRHRLGINPPSWASVEDALKPQSKSTSASSGR